MAPPGGGVAAVPLGPGVPTDALPPDALIAGVDEVGRGPLAGPVVAAAVILDAARPVAGLADSKTLTAEQRRELDGLVRQRARAVALGSASVAEIEQLNILGASMLAMQRAVAALIPAPVHVLVDGDRLPPLPLPATAVVGGDARCPAIAAASIVAKVARDAEMVALDALHPGYGFASHKGYSTPQHRAALEQLGVTPVHRRGFAPVRALIPSTGDEPPPLQELDLSP